MNNLIRNASLLLCFSLCAVEARRWQDLVDRSIYVQNYLDQARYQLEIERDPFVRPSAIPDATPTSQPVSSTWMTRSPAPTLAPSAIPSDSPSLSPTAPTSSPTLRSENVDGNGGCHNGTVLYRVNMYDTWGDGWSSNTKLTITGIKDQDTTQVSGNTVTKTHTSTQGGTTVSISTTVDLASDHPFGNVSTGTGHTYVNPLGQIFQGSLHSGSHGYAYVCLVARRCYDVVVHGGDYLNEVSWDIEPITLGSSAGNATPVIEGGAPLDCYFSIPDQNGEYFCQANCTTILHSQHTQAPALVNHLSPLVRTGSTASTTQSAAQSYSMSTAKRNGKNLLQAIRNNRGNN